MTGTGSFFDHGTRDLRVVSVPYADYMLMKFSDRALVMEKIRDLTLISDILPTGFHGCVSAGVKQGSHVYIAGAGPVGRCAAARALLLEAACVIDGDQNPERLKLLSDAGCETIDLCNTAPLLDQIEQILGAHQVDCGVDAVCIPVLHSSVQNRSRNVTSKKSIASPGLVSLRTAPGSKCV